MKETYKYLKSFFKDKDVASITPTSRFCIRHVCKPINFTKDITIVEYGAGTGVYAEYLLEKMSPESSLIMFETNEQLFNELEKIDDNRVKNYNCSVEFVDEVIDNSLVGTVDYIISGIPFSFLPGETRMNILKKSYEVLRPVGQFLAYQTSDHLIEPLKQVFGNVHTEWEWRNIPPMTVYKSVKE